MIFSFLNLLTLKTTKPTWRVGRLCVGRANSLAELGRGVKFVDVALGARPTSASCDCNRGRNTSRLLGFSNLKTRLLFLRSSQIVVVGFGHSDSICQSKLTPNRYQSVRAQILKANISLNSKPHLSEIQGRADPPKSNSIEFSSRLLAFEIPYASCLSSA
ncbi:hypothetical protein DVH24_012882 [Malus domestica]|uniref:Uncharacterized protein n=1 Tax=Malus domestica TaxID=3750 RepID=A0A498HNS5_MALDO|nr:hypothetical protein DVH24_012882 [Malus domestica]